MQSDVDKARFQCYFGNTNTGYYCNSKNGGIVDCSGYLVSSFCLLRVADGDVQVTDSSQSHDCIGFIDFPKLGRIYRVDKLRFGLAGSGGTGKRLLVFNLSKPSTTYS